MSKKSLFNKEPQISRLPVSTTFKEDFERRRRKQEIERAQKLYGKDALQEEDSCSESQDDDAQLVNEKMQAKFLAHIARLKTKHSAIYGLQEPVFDDEDFEEEKPTKKKKGTKVGVSDVIIRDYHQPTLGLDISQPEEQSEIRKNQHLQQLKDSFKNAVQNESDLLKIKPKSKAQVEDERKALERIAKEKARPEDKGILEEFWVDDSKLDDVDKYLRNYLLTKGWIDRSGKQQLDQVDLEDEQRSEEMDKFERDYNFRFEEPGGNELVTYPRQVETARTKEPSKRKQRVKEKGRTQHIQKQTQRARQLKKQEIMDRASRVIQVGKLQSHPSHISSMLEGQWDEKEHDHLMSQQFNDQYYMHSEQAESEIIEDQQNEGDQDKDNVLNAKPGIPISQRKALKEQEAKYLKEDLNIWWYCDKCLKGIQPNEQRLDCQECPDFTICKMCVESAKHPHKMKRFTVPSSCTPPSDQQIKQMLKDVQKCKDCSSKLVEEDLYYTKGRQIACQDCWDRLAPKEQRLWKKHEGQRDIEELLESDPSALKRMDEKLDQLVDEYSALNYEDILPSGLKTKFKYIETKPDSFGLSNEQLLMADDSVLNQYLSIKQLAPYREQRPKVKNSVYKSKLQRIKDSTKERKKKIRRKKAEVEKVDEVGMESKKAEVRREPWQRDVGQSAISKQRLESYGL